ncbi:MAG TPA: pyridoxal phosphate-dependent aminotransferase [Syntrophorhabdaceae bacterium]|nr:pyridoxal phosphate-dependent aminotransferase [Syntrophorhabdaceae bacterium]HOT41141.1 pyridoxal phosphate-dependent aminotransferase [Syntrophorhabdaceae bacterium]HPP41685.1 pyridoxal phosphate-dependent aminotransferase [Syntrophorhabdaceae bacterium]HQK45786.1 pyridoxal phosphate-dependent aminotransferase [Syntrophorhabdaceae bacterium]
MQLSDRVMNVRPSGVRKIFDLARKVKDPINLSIGEPDFDIPEPIKDEGIAWIKAGFNKYTPSGGIPELREMLLNHLKQDKGIICDDVIITAGVTGGLLLALMVTLNPLDEVIIPDPYFVLYEYQVLLLGGRPVFIDTYPDFTIKEDRLRAAITDRTKVILVNSPNNPTGMVCSREELEMVARVAREKNILLFSDDIYDRFVYENGDERVYLGSLYDRTLTFGGFSKTWGMTGWRLGYVAGPSEIIQCMVTMQQYVFSSVNSFAQKAALKALRYNTDSLIDAYKRKRDLIYEGLKDKYNVLKPKGAYFIFPEVPDGDGDRFVEKALKKKLFIIPGSVFSSRKTNVRISFAASEGDIIKGIEILRKMA